VIHLERTFDYPLLSKLLRDPVLYPWISDDFSPPLDQVEAIQHPELWYVVARDSVGNSFGFFRLNPLNAICWELHTVMRLNARALEAMKTLFPWFWQQAQATRIVTYVPRFNQVAQRFAKRAGFEQYGLNEKSYRKNGIDHDLILYGVTRPR
jgi:RimJ/RimL family protein N-acetyltransferase